MTEIASQQDISTEEAETEIPFRHLHPLSIVMRTLSSAGQNFIALAVLHFSLFDGNFLYTGLAAIGLLALIAGLTGLSWWRFTYQIGAQEIRIKSGLLARNNRSIPFDRIQDVSLEQKLFARLLGLATVKLETGASAGEDDKLNALSRDDARAFRDIIRNYKSGERTTTKSSEEAPEETESTPIFAMDNRRIFVAGLFNFSFVLFAAVAALAQNADYLFDIPELEIWYWLDRFGNIETLDSLSLVTRILGIAGALLSVVLVGVVSGLIRTFIREYGFRLDRVDAGQAGFRRRRGLFTLTDMVMPIHRVQAAILKTGPIRERFGWHHLKFQSLASDGSGESDHSAAPCARMAEIDPILDETDITNVEPELEFQNVHSALWWRNALLLALLLTAVALGNAMFVHPAFGALLILWLPLALLMFLNWRRHKYVLTRDQLFVRTGWWRRKLTILPLRKIQSVDVEESPLDHPLDLASLTIGVAGGSAMAPLKINAIDRGLAMKLRERVLSPS